MDSSLDPLELAATCRDFVASRKPFGRPLDWGDNLDSAAAAITCPELVIRVIVGAIFTTGTDELRTDFTKVLFDIVL